MCRIGGSDRVEGSTVEGVCGCHPRNNAHARHGGERERGSLEEQLAGGKEVGGTVGSHATKGLECLTDIHPLTLWVLVFTNRTLPAKSLHLEAGNAHLNT